MAKIIKKKKRLRIDRLAVVVFIFACLLSLSSSLFLRSYNNSLSMKVQQVEVQIAALEVENEALEVAIQTLITKDRVIQVAEDNGLTMNQSNVVTVANKGD